MTGRLPSSEELEKLVFQLISRGLPPQQAVDMATKALFQPLVQRAVEEGVAYRQMVEQEERDPTGLYSEGGLSAGGIFGEGAVTLPDHDAAARRRGVETRSQMAGAMDRMAMARLMEQQQQLLAAHQAAVQQLAVQAASQKLLAQAAAAAAAREFEEEESDPWKHPEKGRRKRNR